jgi:hypothetical protein
MEDRGWKIEDCIPLMTDLLSSIFYPRSSILDPRSSILALQAQNKRERSLASLDQYNLIIPIVQVELAALQPEAQ